MSNQQDELTHPHFALIYIDRDGNLRHEASQSVANSRESILSPRVTDAFLRAVARSREPVPSHSHCKCVTYLSFTSLNSSTALRNGTTSGQGPLPPPQLNQVPHINESRSIERHGRVVPVTQGPPMDPTMWPTQRQQESWPPSQWHNQSPQNRRRQPWNEEISMTSTQKSLISIRDKDFVLRYYEKVFQNLQQTNCRVLAKAYIKLVEPRKQVNYPYNGRKLVGGRTQQLDPDETKPPWWPSGVSHREPDHLPKAERIRLLIHLLCELRTSHGITAQRLKEADQPIRRQIVPAERLQIMDEVYEVRGEEEKFIDGKTEKPQSTQYSSTILDGKTLVSISRSNLPDPVASPSLPKQTTRKNTPTEEAASSQDHLAETMCIRSGPTRIPSTPQATLAPREVPANISPNPPIASSHSPTQYANPELPIHPGVDPSQVPMSAASMSAQDLSRKRQRVETGIQPAAAPNPLEYYTSAYVGPQQPFMPENYPELQGFQPQDPIAGQQQPPNESFGEDMDSSTFPYYFQY
ncbi:hypothetical protein N7456_010910 [Penicillium angulare]|uniref:Subtelomeric hrmA-associated cluster protein AFUB-079030/YDR124W-like helical bundle domain-containing protein n=1 Tax=Penicillium angulare TaxID=116970 RepID=A0A9W9ESZ4_9EURO|nr:hypothetical protein N7456_010910 [Penicillium angulare]